MSKKHYYNLDNISDNTQYTLVFSERHHGRTYVTLIHCLKRHIEKLIGNIHLNGKLEML